MDEEQLELLKAAARQRLAAGQGELDLGLDVGADGGGPLPITSSRMEHLWDALARAYEVLGFEENRVGPTRARPKAGSSRPQRNG